VAIAVQDTLEQDNTMELYEQDAVNVIARARSC
jgi:hypothetical protein